MEFFGDSSIRQKVLNFVHLFVHVLAKTQTPPQIIRMRSGRSANALVRMALAIIFGFMSLFHGTVMAFAKANPAVAHHAMIAAHHVGKAGSNAAGHHHHHADHQKQSVPAMPDAPPSCYGVGCFIVLDSAAPLPPAASILPIAILSPSIASAMIPVHVDPVVPPPRIQV